jgi:hypothetical protein
MYAIGTLLLLLAQEDVYIRKIDKVRYIEAVQSCRDAEAKMEADESTAIDRLTRILQDPGITEVECSLRIQTSDNYGPPYAFLPYQYRGRARLSLAKKSSSAAEKKQLIEEAIRDLKVSVGKKVSSSQKYLDAAQADLATLSQPVPAAPDRSGAELRARWAQQLADRNFKNAQRLVESGGAALPDGDRASLLADTQKACRQYLTEQMRIFRRNWNSASSVAELRALTREEFETAFALPDPREIVTPHPSYDWARAHQDALRDLRSDKDPLAGLLAMAEASLRLEDAGENPWFKLAEGLAYQTAFGAVEKRMTECVDAPKARREALLAETQALLKTWTGFAGRLDPAFRSRTEVVDRHTQSLTAQLGRKPRELEELDHEDLRSCFEGFPVTDRLLGAEQKFSAREAEGGISRESRRQLLTLIVAARSLRLLIEGRPEDQVQVAVRSDLQKLATLGGASEPDRFGPRLRRIFDSLR